MSGRVHLDVLRHAIALVHAVPGASLHVVDSGGRSLVVAHGTVGAPIDPCALRLAFGRGTVPAWVMRAEQLCARGLVDLGGGVHARIIGGTHERWLTVAGPVDAVAPELAACAVDDDHIAAHVIADDLLGITVVRLTAPAPSAAHLDEVAAAASAALLSLEIVAFARSLSARSPSHPDHRS